MSRSDERSRVHTRNRRRITGFQFRSLWHQIVKDKNKLIAKYRRLADTNPGVLNVNHLYEVRIPSSIKKYQHIPNAMENLNAMILDTLRPFYVFQAPYKEDVAEGAVFYFNCARRNDPEDPCDGSLEIFHNFKMLKIHIWHRHGHNLAQRTDLLRPAGHLINVRNAQESMSWASSRRIRRLIAAAGADSGRITEIIDHPLPNSDCDHLFAASGDALGSGSDSRSCTRCLNEADLNLNADKAAESSHSDVPSGAASNDSPDAPSEAFSEASEPAPDDDAQSSSDGDSDEENGEGQNYRLEDDTPESWLYDDGDSIAHAWIRKAACEGALSSPYLLLEASTVCCHDGCAYLFTLTAQTGSDLVIVAYMIYVKGVGGGVVLDDGSHDPRNPVSVADFWVRLHKEGFRNFRTSFPASVSEHVSCDVEVIAAERLEAGNKKIERVCRWFLRLVQQQGFADNVCAFSPNRLLDRAVTSVFDRPQGNESLRFVLKAIVRAMLSVPQCITPESLLFYYGHGPAYAEVAGDTTWVRRGRDADGAVLASSHDYRVVNRRFPALSTEELDELDALIEGQMRASYETLQSATYSEWCSARIFRWCMANNMPAAWLCLWRVMYHSGIRHRWLSPDVPSFHLVPYLLHSSMHVLFEAAPPEDVTDLEVIVLRTCSAIEEYIGVFGAPPEEGQENEMAIALRSRPERLPAEDRFLCSCKYRRKPHSHLNVTLEATMAPPARTRDLLHVYNVLEETDALPPEPVPSAQAIKAHRRTVAEILATRVSSPYADPPESEPQD